MIQILNVKILNETGTQTLMEDSPKLNMADENLLEMWRQHMKSKYKKIFNQPVRVDVLRRQRPPENIDPMSMAIEACNHLGVRISTFLSKSRKREVVEARICVNQIAHESGFTPTEIAKSLEDDRCMYYHRVKSFNNLSTTDKQFAKKYNETKDKVMNKLYKK